MLAYIRKKTETFEDRINKHAPHESRIKTAVNISDNVFIDQNHIARSQEKLSEL